VATNLGFKAFRPFLLHRLPEMIYAICLPFLAILNNHEVCPVTQLASGSLFRISNEVSLDNAFVLIEGHPTPGCFEALALPCGRRN
jgi:hypothetical protein